MGLQTWRFRSDSAINGAGLKTNRDFTDLYQKRVPGGGKSSLTCEMLLEFAMRCQHLVLTKRDIVGASVKACLSRLVYNFAGVDMPPANIWQAVCRLHKKAVKLGKQERSTNLKATLSLPWPVSQG